MKQAELEEAINGLARLLRNAESDEGKYQKFFEDNPIIFKVLGYEKSYPQMQLNYSNGKYIVPDFLVKLPNGLFEVFELKTPQEKLVKTKKNREGLYAKIDEYISQVETYAEYFDDQANREFVKRTYSIDVQNKPDMSIVVGTDDGVDKKLLHKLLRRKSNTIKLLTYDDLLSNLMLYHVTFFGYSESFPGTSIHIILELPRNKFQRPMYIFDTGQGYLKNRISLYLDERDRLNFEIIDSKGKSYTVSTTFGKYDFKPKKRCFIGCLFGNSTNFSFLQLLINNRIAAKTEVSSHIDIWLPEAIFSQTNFGIGADINGQNNAKMTVQAFAIYKIALTFKQRSELAENIFNQFFP